MATPPVDSFVTAAGDAGCAVTRSGAATAVEALAEAVREPAIGTPLPFDGVSVEEAPIDPSPTGADLRRAATGVTAATLGIGDYGSVVLTESGRGEELLGIYPDLHVVVLAASDVVPDMQTAVDEIGTAVASGSGDAIIATGPSATADMGSVVTGVHGPKAVHVVLLEDR
jgi:L-lactate dehydrogenase complex protein LldG